MEWLGMVVGALVIARALPLAALSALAVAAGAARSTSGEPRTVSAGATPEVHAAAPAGFELPVLLTLGVVVVLAAVGVTTVR